MSTQFDYNPELVLAALPAIIPREEGAMLDHLGAGAVFQALIDAGSVLADRDNEIALAVYKQVSEDLQDRQAGAYYLLHETILIGLINRAVRQGMAQATLDIAQSLANEQIAQGMNSILRDTSSDDQSDG